MKNVTFTDSVLEKSQQSVRIKTVSGANGTVDGVTYRNIQMSGGDAYGIIVDQAYNGVACVYSFLPYCFMGSLGSWGLEASQEW